MAKMLAANKWLFEAEEESIGGGGLSGGGGSSNGDARSRERGSGEALPKKLPPGLYGGYFAGAWVVASGGEGERGRGEGSLA